MTEKLKDITWSKPGFDYFQIQHLVTLLVDKRWTILGLVEIQSLATFLPSTTFPQNCIYITVYVAWANLGQVLDYKILRLSRICLHVSFVIEIV